MPKKHTACVPRDSSALVENVPRVVHHQYWQLHTVLISRAQKWRANWGTFAALLHLHDMDSRSHSTTQSAPSSRGEQTDDQAQQQAAGCGVCRITGTGTLAGVSAWLLFERRRVEPKALLHRRMLLGMSLLSLAGAYVRWSVG